MFDKVQPKPLALKQHNFQHAATSLTFNLLCKLEMVITNSKYLKAANEMRCVKCLINPKVLSGVEFVIIPPFWNFLYV